mmetsp:Transcript_32151/g.46724  ORF Transcript_32151/g.46724 Transcript_32151/m.46724 type:complete len:208 (-) Transcript_32151:1652-2275(-)
MAWDLGKRVRKAIDIRPKELPRIMPRRAMTTLQTPKPDSNVIPLTTPRLSITLGKVTNLKLLHQIIKIIRQQQLIIRLNEGILRRNLTRRENETTTTRNRTARCSGTRTTNRIVPMLYCTSGWNNGRRQRMSMKWRGSCRISRMRMMQRLIIRGRKWRRRPSIVMRRWNTLLLMMMLMMMLMKRLILRYHPSRRIRGLYLACKIRRS